MSSANNRTDNILRRIQNYAIAAIVLTAAIITLISIYPMYMRLEQVEQKGVIFARDTSVFIIDEYLKHLKNIARQIADQSKASLIINEYHKGKIDREKMATLLKVLLNSALSDNAHLMGIAQLDTDGKIIVQVGKPIPISLWPHNSTKKQTLTGPIKLNNHYYLGIQTPLPMTTQTYIGTNLALFDITDLQNDIDENMQNHPGNTLISYLENNKPVLFYPFHTEWGKSMTQASPLYRTLVDTIINQKKELLSTNLNSTDVFIAHAPTSQTTWGVAVIVQKTALMAAIKRTLWTILIVITVVVIIFISGLEFFTKPISSRILLEHKELEDQIKKSQIKLQLINEKLQHLVDHDFLTNALNRRGFNCALEREISRANRHNLEFTLLYIDLNEFKKINDTYGHSAGDAVLIHTTERIKTVIRKEDMLARIGGDEFAVIMPNINEEGGKKLQEKIKNIVNQPVTFGKEFLPCSASVGAATFPNQGNNMEALMQYADASMYRNKNGNPPKL